MYPSVLLFCCLKTRNRPFPPQPRVKLPDFHPPQTELFYSQKKGVQKMKTLILTLGALILAATLHAADSETIKGAKKDLETFKKDMVVKLDKLQTQIETIKKQAHDKGDEAKDKTADELAATRDDVKEKVAKLSDDAGDDWQKMKKSLADSVDSLNKKVQKALK
jgi:hypothetical protein